ncbi:cell surface protein, partial [Streptococcus pyogenes]
MLVTVSNMALLNSQATISVEAESLDTNPVSILSAENFSFTATIIDSKGATLAGKSVVLTDITDGTPKEIKTLSSNEQGKALFTNLPLNRNISVSVDGKEKGYT